MLARARVCGRLLGLMGLRDFAISQVMGADSSCPAVTECFQRRHYYRSQHESLPRVMKLGEKGARHPAAVPIVGETGTGEEMIARLITIIPCALERRRWHEAPPPTGCLFGPPEGHTGFTYTL